MMLQAGLSHINTDHKKKAFEIRKIKNKRYIPKRVWIELIKFSLLAILEIGLRNLQLHPVKSYWIFNCRATQDVVIIWLFVSKIICEQSC